MMKGLKRRISIVLAAAMVLTMNTPVLAGQNDILTLDEGVNEIMTPQTEAAEEDASYGLLDDLKDRIGGKADDLLGKFDDLTGWKVWSLSKNAAATSYDYAYDGNTKTIVIKDVSGNTAGIKVSPITGASELISANLINSASANVVPVTVSADSDFAGLGTINVYKNEHTGPVTTGTDTLVIKRVGSEYSYVDAGKQMDGTYLIAAEKEMVGPEATINDDGNIRITAGDVIGLAQIFAAGDSSLTIDEVEKKVLHAEGNGRYAVITGTSGKEAAAKILNYKTLSLDDETLSVDSVSNDSITGNVRNTVSGQAYEVAAFTDNDLTNMAGRPVKSVDGSFRIGSLSANTTYYLSLRQVSNNIINEQIADDKVLYVPSAWRSSPVEVKTTEASTDVYEIDTVSGSSLVISGTGADKTADMYKVVINNEVKYAQGAEIILKENGQPIDGIVAWSSDNTEAVSVGSASGIVQVADGAADGAKAVISAKYGMPLKEVARLTVTVKTEGGSISFNDLSGSAISSLEMGTNDNKEFKVSYPDMAGKVTLSVDDIDIVTVTKDASRSTTGYTVYKVNSKDVNGDANIVINAAFAASNGQTCMENLRLPVSVKAYALKFDGVETGSGNNYIKIGTTTAKVVANFSGATYTSENPAVAAVSENSGVITPVKAGKVRFAATGTVSSQSVSGRSGELYIVDPTVTVTPSSKYVSRGKSFTVTASFPEDYYKVSNISLASASRSVSAGSYDAANKTLTLNVTNDVWSDNVVPLIFNVTATSDITGETSLSAQGTTTVTITGNEGHDGEDTPATEAGVVDISKDTFKAYQVEPTFNLWDKNAYTTVYFVGSTADPELVSSNNAYFNYETIAGTGYTKVKITLRDEYKKIDKINEVAKNGKKIEFSLWLGKFENKSAKITLKVSAKLPTVALTNKSGTAYAVSENQYCAVFSTTDKNGLFADENTTADYRESKSASQPVKEIGVICAENAARIESANVEKDYKNGGLYITNNNWVEGAYVFAPFRITKAKSNAKPAIKLGKTSATIINKAGQKFSTNVYLNGGMFMADSDYEVACNPVEDGLVASMEMGNLVISTTKAVKAGKYEITIKTKESASIKASKEAKFKLTVTDKPAKVSYSVKGKLDSIADDTAVYVIPKLTNASGDITLPDGSLEALKAMGLTAEVIDGIICITKDDDYAKYEGSLQFIEKGNYTFNSFKIAVGGTEVSSKLVVPVVLGKLTAAGTGINFKDTEAEYGTSAIEAVYVYSKYNQAGKAYTKGYYTFSGSQLTLSDQKAGKLNPTVVSPGLVKVKNPNESKNYYGSVKVTIAGTSIKTVTAKFKIIGK